MRSSAALLIAVALSVNAIPVPKPKAEMATPAKLALREPATMPVFKHRHYDAVVKRAAESRPTTHVWKHRHFDAASAAPQRRDDMPAPRRHRQHHGHGKDCGNGAPTTSAPSEPTTVPTETTSADPQPTESAPADPAPQDPAPQDPAPQDPAPQDPAPQDPAPQDPAPQDPAPQDPAPQDPAPQDPAPQDPAPQDPPAPTPNASPNAQAYLDPHNAARAQHGAQAVTWDDNLANLAQQWVNGCKFEHSGGSLTSDFGYGENLAAGTGEYPIGDAVTSWVNEQDKYDYNNPGFSMDTGHFTQVVWKSTTAIGCAYADCPSSTGPFGDGYGPTWRLHSCMYTPPGNYEGQYPENVTPN